MGRTWWLVITRVPDSQGPHHSSARHDHAQKSKEGFGLGGDFAFGIVSLETKAGCKNLLLLRFDAASDRREPFLALPPKFLRADAVAVDGEKMEM